MAKKAYQDGHTKVEDDFKQGKGTRYTNLLSVASFFPQFQNWAEPNFSCYE